MTAKALYSFLVMTWIIESTCVGQVPPKVERGAVFLHVVDDFGGSVIPTDVRILNQAGANVCGEALLH